MLHAAPSTSDLFHFCVRISNTSLESISQAIRCATAQFPRSSRFLCASVVITTTTASFKFNAKYDDVDDLPAFLEPEYTARTVFILLVHRLTTLDPLKAIQLGEKIWNIILTMVCSNLVVVLWDDSDLMPG